MAHRLTHGPGTAAKPLTIPTLLTQANQGVERDRVRTCATRENGPTKLEALAACRECGVILEDRSRHYCGDCLPAYRDAQAAEKRRTMMKQRRKEELDWDAAHPDVRVDEEIFAREILPQLQRLSLSVISEHTGLSQQYCSLIRRGLYVPHPRHWAALRRLAIPNE